MVDLKLLSFGLGKQKIAILVVWFASLVGVRMLLGFAFSNLWIGTVGAVAVTFVLFYLALVHTPLRRYRLAVNEILRDWYRQKYLLYSVAVSGSVIMTIIVFIEYGYATHSEEIVSISELNTIQAAQQHVDYSIRELGLKGYSILDAASITAASVDKSLQGYYLKSASFVFAEHLEVIAFMLLARKSATLFS
ncbi:MAG: hypothetical protein MN733_10860 [Nitrososphaera sp.]|nr:hypothetical protein [Nitrososphaera sp.]